MPDGVVATVEQMAQAKQQPLLGYGAPLFEWSPGVGIIDQEMEIPFLLDKNDNA